MQPLNAAYVTLKLRRKTKYCCHSPGASVTGSTWGSVVELADLADAIAGATGLLDSGQRDVADAAAGRAQGGLGDVKQLQQLAVWQGAVGRGDSYCCLHPAVAGQKLWGGHRLGLPIHEKSWL